jgi:hypothetical protein
MISNDGGNNNTGIGYAALGTNDAGNGNSAVGVQALQSNTSGSNNAGFGFQTLGINSTGIDNTGCGTFALNLNSSGSYNTGLGYRAGVSTFNLDNATAVGAQAQVACSNCMVLGSISGVNSATSNVNVGIGISSPAYPLNFATSTGDKISLYGTSTAHYGFGVTGGLLQIHADNSTSDVAIGYGSSGSFTERMRVKGSGNVGIGTTSPTDKLYVVGNIVATGSVTSLSDERYKREVSSMNGIMPSLMQLRPVFYRWKHNEYPQNNFSDTRQIGFIAQELEKVYPELVHMGGDGYRSVDYSKLTPLLVAALQEQQVQIKAIQAELDALKAAQH